MYLEYRWPAEIVKTSRLAPAGTPAAAFTTRYSRRGRHARSIHKDFTRTPPACSPAARNSPLNRALRRVDDSSTFIELDFPRPGGRRGGGVASRVNGIPCGLFSQILERLERYREVVISAVLLFFSSFLLFFSSFLSFPLFLSFVFYRVRNFWLERSAPARFGNKSRLQVDSSFIYRVTSKIAVGRVGNVMSVCAMAVPCHDTNYVARTCKSARAHARAMDRRIENDGIFIRPFIKRPYYRPRYPPRWSKIFHATRTYLLASRSRY